MKETLGILLFLFFLFLVFILLIYVLLRRIYRKIRDKVKDYFYSEKKTVNKSKELEEEERIKKILPEELNLYKSTSHNVHQNSNVQYHINLDGKILPCRNNVLLCPYGKWFHSHNKIDLYFTLFKTDRINEKPNNQIVKEIMESSKFPNLHPLSSNIEKAQNPVEAILATLGKVLTTLDAKEIRDQRYEMHSKRASFEYETESIISDLLFYGGGKILRKIEHRIPKNILDIGKATGYDQIHVNYKCQY